MKKEIKDKKYRDIILMHGFSLKSFFVIHVNFIQLVIYFIFHGESEARLQVQRELSAEKQRSVYLPRVIQLQSRVLPA